MPPTSRGASARIDALVHEYPTRAGPLRVLDGVALTVEPGDYVALAGPSGVGKSTLLSIIGGLEAPQRGSVVVDGHELAGLDEDGLAAFRRTTVGFVFQHFGLLETLSALENVELAGALERISRAERRRRARELLAGVGLDDRADHRPAQLSGGERQRVAIARALMNRPRLLLADEPTGNLDEASAGAVVDLIEQVRTDTGTTVIVVTHNAAVARRVERRLDLRAGRVSAAAT